MVATLSRYFKNNAVNNSLTLKLYMVYLYYCIFENT